jgi:di/tricarboxylate transporter
MSSTARQVLPKITVSRVVVWCLAGLSVIVMALTEPSDVLVRVGAISALAVALFATRLLPEVVTALGCFLAFIAIGAAPNEVIFSGFASSGFWLLFAGLVIGTAITATGLGMQVALRIFQRTGDSYVKAALLLGVSGLGLGVLVPATIPRVIIMLPIALALAKTMGYAIGSRGHVGLTVTAAVATNLPTFAFLTGNLPTIVHIGAFETLYGIRPAYGQYFIQQAPINLVRFAALLVLMLPFAPRRAETASALDAPTPFTSVQKLLSVLIGVAILFWVTDAWHGISPAWIALSLAAVLMVPAFGILDETAMKTKIDMSTAFFLAAVFAISAVAQHTGLSTVIADRLIPLLQLGQGSDLRDLYSVVGISTLLSHFTTAPAAPAVLAPLAGAFAAETGWSIETISMSQVIGLATPVLPHQAPPLIVSMALAQIPIAALLRICAGLAAAVTVIGIPLTFVWWNYLGMFG